MTVPFDYDALLDVEATARAYVACSHEQMRQEKGKGHCPHTTVHGGDQDVSCFMRTLNALMALDATRESVGGRPGEGTPP